MLKPKFSPLFVAGASRSGTTLVAQWLSLKGENIAFWPMDLFVDNVCLKYWLEKKKFPSNKKRSLVLHWLTAERARKVCPLDLYNSSLKKLLERIDPCISFDQVVTTIMALYAEEQGKVAWGAKENYLEVFGHLVLSLYPKACFLILIRDPRASVCSELYFGTFPERNKAPESNFWFRLAYWGIAVQSALELRETFPRQVILLRYEDLIVKRDLEVLKKKGIIVGGEPPMDFQFSSYGERKEKGLYRKSIKKWKELLTAREIFSIEASVGHLLSKMHYSPICLKEGRRGSLQVALVRRLVAVAATNPVFSFCLARFLFNPRQTLDQTLKQKVRSLMRVPFG